MEGRQLFEKCIPIVILSEKGYSNDPDDPGGATLNGITQITYDNWRKRKGLPVRPVINMTPEEQDAIYYENYWLPMNLTGIKNEGLILQLFDMGVNAGIRTAIKLIQGVVEAKKDGILGPQTTMLINQYDKSVSLIEIYKHERKKHYLCLTLKNPKLKKFLRGWINRVNNTKF